MQVHAKLSVTDGAPQIAWQRTIWEGVQLRDGHSNVVDESFLNFGLGIYSRYARNASLVNLVRTGMPVRAGASAAQTRTEKTKQGLGARATFESMTSSSETRIQRKSPGRPLCATSG